MGWRRAGGGGRWVVCGVVGWWGGGGGFGGSPHSWHRQACLHVHLPASPVLSLKRIKGSKGRGKGVVGGGRKCKIRGKRGHAVLSPPPPPPPKTVPAAVPVSCLHHAPCHPGQCHANQPHPAPHAPEHSTHGRRRRKMAAGTL